MNIFAKLIGLLVVCSFSANAKDNFVSFSIKEKIGYQDAPTVFVELELNKTRDLYVAIQDAKEWKTVKRTMKRVKKSGKYHFEIPVENLKPGTYRVDAYITPRGKDWNSRIGDSKQVMMQVVDEPNFVEQTAFSSMDKVRFVDWPEQIVGVQEAILMVKYEITEPRDLILKLLNSDNWQEHGELKFPVEEPGNFSLPLSHLTEDFNEGKYAWVIYLTEQGQNEPVSDKYGKHFVLSKAE